MNKVVCITGAAKRIGAEIAHRFHAQGFNVALHVNRSMDEGNAVVAALNQSRADSAVLLQADLTQKTEVDRLGDEFLAAFGSVDVLVNNASSFYPTSLNDIDHSSWDDLFDSNLRAGYFLTLKVAEELKRNKGAVINLVDTHADRPLAGFSPYSIAKAGVKSMTRSLSIELAPNVRVNGVSPGAILWPPALEDDNDPEVLEKRKTVLKKIPLQRLGAKSDIAEAVFYLATEAHYITGQVLKVDGGRSLI